MKLDPKYVLAPLHRFVNETQLNVQLGLRIAESTSKLPGPTRQERNLINILFGETPTDTETVKGSFRKWVLCKGFEDLHKMLRSTLERTLVFVRIRQEIKRDPNIDTKVREGKLQESAKKLTFRPLLTGIEKTIGKPLKLGKHLDSFNCVRNCLVHDGGLVGASRCNSPTSKELILYGRRFKLSWDDGQDAHPATIGAAGPANASLMLSAEDFQIVFGVGQSVDLTLKDFVDVVNTIVFVRAELDSELAR